MKKSIIFILLVAMVLNVASISKVDLVYAVEPENKCLEKEYNMIATPTASKVLVNNKETSFDAYLIEDNNYFKLRDLAFVINGTKKQFEVNWDASKNTINLISNKPYMPNGREMVSGKGVKKTAILNSAFIYKDGFELELNAYNIDGNNYFKLRDIAKAFDIGVTYDNMTKTIGIDTSLSYEIEANKEEKDPNVVALSKEEHQLLYYEEEPSIEKKQEAKVVKVNRKTEFLEKANQVQIYIDKKHDMDNFINMWDMIDAEYEAYSKWDDLLNDIWGVLKGNLPEDEMEKLLKEQRQWIKDKEVIAKANSEDSKGGSMERLDYACSLSETTEKRCKELIERYMD